MSRRPQDLLLDSLREERESQYLYRAMEEAEDGRVSALFRQLRQASARQALLWEEDIRQTGGTVPAFKPSLRTRVVAILIRRLGPRRLLPVLAASKVRGLSIYRGRGPLAEVGVEGTVAGPKGTPEVRAAGRETRHRGAQSGVALRAAVFGMMDGLLSSSALIIGVAGAEPDPEVIILAGTAGLLAGSFSMAAGEYISMRAQREMFERQIALEREELSAMPEEEVEELALIYEAKGLDAAEARSLAERLVADPEAGLDTLAREELGLDPEELGSPVTAAAASFSAFAVGAFFPLAPYILIRSHGALTLTLATTLIGLLAIGASMSLFTGRGALYSALRMTLIGAVAAGATFFIGRLLGVAAS